jgi:glycosyltransferase involved in cell wall biosynthesis
MSIRSDAAGRSGYIPSPGRPGSGAIGQARHIVLITTSYPDGTPGSEAAGSFVADFAHALAGRFRVTVLAAGSRDRQETDGGLSVRRFAVPRLPLSLLRASWPGDWPEIYRSLRAGSHALEDLVANDRPDHVLALWALPGGYWANRAGKRHGLPYSVWALGSDVWTLGRIPVLRRILGHVLRRAEHCYADGLELARDVERLSARPCGFLPSTRRLPEPANNSVASARPYKFAFLGRWHENKGVDLLLTALESLTEADWLGVREVRIFGGGPLESALHKGVEKLQDKRRPVTLGAYLDKQGAADLIGWADYLLLPSRIESIPVVFSDAVQLATPVIAMPVGDLPRLYRDFDVGVLAGTATAAAFADALRVALARDASGFAAGLESAREYFDLDRSAERLAADIDA